MADLAVSTPTIDGFFRRWEASGAAERANNSMFLNELCDLLDVPRPDPAGPDDEKNAYVFERAVPFPNPDGSTTVKRIDLYKRDCFVLEAKQGSDRVEAAEPFSLTPHRRMRRGTAVRGTAGWDAAMYEAKGQAELYVRNLPASSITRHSSSWRMSATASSCSQTSPARAAPTFLSLTRGPTGSSFMTWPRQRSANG